MGTAYWVNSGFEVAGTEGVTGTASFKAVGELETIKSLSQTVYPANRSCYTFSAQVATEGLRKDNENSMAGVEITIHYEDGTVETQFVKIL